MNSKYVIRMKNGLYYESMNNNRVMVCAMLRNAHRFASRMAAVRVCALTHEFAGASIVDVNEIPDAPPSHKDAL
jgi:hypothetical protein